VVLRLSSTHPDQQNRTAEEGAETVKAVLKAVGVPLIVYGPGQAQKDNEVLLKVAEAAAGERIALGDIENTNYRTIVAAALGSGQLVIAQSPIDVNMAKSPDGSDHWGPRLRNGIHLVRDGETAPQRLPERLHDSISYDLHCRGGVVEAEGVQGYRGHSGDLGRNLGALHCVGDSDGHHLAPGRR
jgi:hypothetical protein